MKPMNKNRILYEDNDIIVCHKPAGIATQTARVGQADMVSEITNYLAMTMKSNAPSHCTENKTERVTNESPYVGVVHRLDQPVEGVLVLAKNSRAASALSRQIAENRMEKYYYAVVCGQEFEPSGELTHYLFKDGKTNTSQIVSPEMKGAKKAVLDYRIVTKTDYREASKEDAVYQIALAEIRLHTGRHHQIRVQMSHAGMSLLGDYKYADERTVKISEQMHMKEIALCAYRLSFRHPGNGKQLHFRIEPEGKSFHPEYWQKYAGYSSYNGT